MTTPLVRLALDGLADICDVGHVQATASVFSFEEAVDRGYHPASFLNALAAPTNPTPCWSSAGPSRETVLGGQGFPKRLPGVCRRT